MNIFHRLRREALLVQNRDYQHISVKFRQDFFVKTMDDLFPDLIYYDIVCISNLMLDIRYENLV